jgi:hypothetical protein
MIFSIFALILLECLGVGFDAKRWVTRTEDVN